MRSVKRPRHVTHQACQRLEPPKPRTRRPGRDAPHALLNELLGAAQGLLTALGAPPDGARTEYVIEAGTRSAVVVPFLTDRGFTRNRIHSKSDPQNAATLRHTRARSVPPHHGCFGIFWHAAYSDSVTCPSEFLSHDLKFVASQLFDGRSFIAT